MKYDTNGEAYLGSCQDMSKRHVDAFLLDDEIHLVYRLGLEDEYVTKEKVEKIKADPDSYLWTPYASFIFDLLS